MHDVRREPEPDVTLTGTVTPAPSDRLKVIAGVTLPEGTTNVTAEDFQANIASAIRRGHPQLRRQGIQPDRVCLLGGGPSLNDTLPELLEALRAGAKLATTNGAYHWALDHHLSPQTQIIIDGRASNARFVDPPLPRCQYLISSTCHPDVWDRLEGREHVWIFHPVTRDDAAAALLDAHYLRRWETVPGGSTVVSRAINALRVAGYVRFDLFGVDCCLLHDQHHAYPQAENEGDKLWKVTVNPSGHPELRREFITTGWMLKGWEDWLRMIRLQGDPPSWLINVHGDGLLAYTLRVNADLIDAEVTAATP